MTPSFSEPLTLTCRSVTSKRFVWSFRSPWAFPAGLKGSCFEKRDCVVPIFNCKSAHSFVTKKKEVETAIIHKTLKCTLKGNGNILQVELFSTCMTCLKSEWSNNRGHDSDLWSPLHRDPIRTRRAGEPSSDFRKSASSDHVTPRLFRGRRGSVFSGICVCVCVKTERNSGDRCAKLVLLE